MVAGDEVAAQECNVAFASTRRVEMAESSIPLQRLPCTPKKLRYNVVVGFSALLPEREREFSS